MRWRVAALVGAQLLGTCLFIVGFFPQRIAQQTPVDHEQGAAGEGGQLPSERRIDRLVVMIIDAFSDDFIRHADYVPDMSRLHASIDSGESVVFRAHVQAPTVTLPRIKAMVSGTIPTYMDVVFNFASSSFDEDNWLVRAIRSGYRILFYGDDTWLSMFPEGIFMSRSEGTSSFFVKDYTEVDTNITRHLPSELSNEKQDWDILLLHYLGLDHIGHSLGGRDPQLHVKLGEMDGVIDGIWRNLTANNHNKERIWFVVMGDHGMTFAGGHGGSSERESFVPVIIRTTDRPAYVRPTVEEIEQVDLVPTISFMLNLSLPSKSVGVGFERRFVEDTRRLWENLERNARQFHQLALSNRGLFSKLALDDLDSCTRIKTADEYSKCSGVLKAAQLSFLSSNENLDMLYIGSGVVLSAVATFCLLVSTLKDELKSANLRWIVLLHPIFLFSSSYIEEEHDLWFVQRAGRHRSSFRYFMFASLLFYELYVGVWDAKSRKVNTKHVELLLAVIFLHRIARFPSELHRRRWALDDEFDILNWDFDYIPADTHYLWTAASILLVVRYFPKGIVWKGGRVSDLVTATAALVVLGTKLELFRHGFAAHLAVLSTFLFADWMRGFLVWQLLVLHPAHYAIGLVCQTIGGIVGRVERADRIGRSALLFAAISASFFYAGGSNSLDTIDVAAGYAGLSAYLPLVVGCQMLLNAYMGPVNVLIGWKHTNHAAVDLSLLVNVVALRSSALLCTTINLFHQRSHLFNWRVFAPKLLVEGLHFFVVCAWIGAEFFFLVCGRRFQFGR